MGRDWVYCPVCNKMVGDCGAECEHYNKYEDWRYNDYLEEKEYEERSKINFWEFCEIEYGVKCDFTNEEDLILSNNTGRMFGGGGIGIFDVPTFNCSFHVDLDKVLQEYRRTKRSDF